MCRAGVCTSDDGADRGGRGAELNWSPSPRRGRGLLPPPSGAIRGPSTRNSLPTPTQPVLPPPDKYRGGWCHTQTDQSHAATEDRD